MVGERERERELGRGLVERKAVDGRVEERSWSAAGRGVRAICGGEGVGDGGVAVWVWWCRDVNLGMCRVLQGFHECIVAGGTVARGESWQQYHGTVQSLFVVCIGVWGFERAHVVSDVGRSGEWRGR